MSPQGNLVKLNTSLYWQISENKRMIIHLRVLATLAGMLAHEEFLELLEKAESYDDLIHGIKQLQL